MMKEFTVKDIADLINISKPTVQRAIKASALEADRIDSQTRFYSYEKTLIIIKKIKPEFDIKTLACFDDAAEVEPQHVAAHTETCTETPLQKPQHVAASTETPPHKPPQKPDYTETPLQKPQHVAAHTETPLQNNEFELVKAMLATLQEQLNAKDKQIAAYEEQLAVKDKQIKDYSARLAEAMQLTKGQQYIAAADKVERLTAVQVKTDNEIPIVKAEIQENTEITTKKKTLLQRIFGKRK